MSRDISILDEALVFMVESLDLLMIPPPPSDDNAALRLVQLLDVQQELADLEFRVHDMRKNIQGPVLPDFSFSAPGSTPTLTRLGTLQGFRTR